MRDRCNSRQASACAACNDYPLVLYSTLCTALSDQDGGQHDTAVSGQAYRWHTLTVPAVQSCFPFGLCFVALNACTRMADKLGTRCLQASQH